MKKLILISLCALMVFTASCQSNGANESGGREPNLSSSVAQSADDGNSTTDSSVKSTSKNTSGTNSNSKTDTSKNSSNKTSNSTENSSNNNSSGVNTSKVTLVNQVEKHGLPIVFLNVGNGYEISETDQEYLSAKITCYNADGSVNIPETSLGARVRGNTTKTFDKKPYALKFDEKTNVYNLTANKSKRYNLLANRCDRTFVRNSVALTFCEQMGINYVPNYQEVELYYNGDYRGAYLLCEAINEDNGRVNVDKKGYLIVLSKNAPKDAPTFKDSENVLYEIKNDNTDVTTIKNKINSALSAIKNGDKSEVEKYIDIDSAVNAYIIEETLNNMDVGWDSFYFTVYDKESKIEFGPLWDFDVTLGNGNDESQYSAGFNACKKSELSVAESRSNLWFYYLCRQQWFREMVVNRWNQAKVKTATADLIENVVKFSDKHKTAYQYDFTKWNKVVNGKIEKVNFENENILELTSYDSQVCYAKKWITERVSWLDEQFNSADYLNGKMPSHDDLD